jgi:predicted nucleic acid-binding protein
MTDAPASTTETIVCDTSFVTIMLSATSNAATTSAWPAEIRARLDAAILAISVITLAELRDGHIYAGWGESRRSRAEQLIGAYLRVPLDMATVDCCANLRATCRRNGVVVPDNDMWIAATALSRGWPLVSCDAHFDLIPGLDHERLPRHAT